MRRRAAPRGRRRGRRARSRGGGCLPAAAPPAPVSAPGGTASPPPPGRRRRRRPRGCRDRDSGAGGSTGGVVGIGGHAQQHLVAGGGLALVADADHLPQLDRHRDRVLQVPAALARVGVERGLVRPPFEHQVEVPRQREGVADARAQCPGPANGGIRWAASPASSMRPSRQRSRPAGAEGVDGVALERHLVGPDPGAGEQLPHELRVFDLLGALSGQQHPLPAPATRSPRDERRGPRGVALLQVDPGQQARVVGDGVGDQPVEGEAEVLQRACPSARARGCWRRRSRSRRRP